MSNQTFTLTMPLLAWSRLIALALLVLPIAGCSGLPIEQATAALREKRVCCNSIGQLVYQPLASDKRTKVALDTSLPAMEFPEGKSFVVAFALPAEIGSLTVQSIYPEYLPDTSYIDPVVVFLDRNKVEIGRYARLDFHEDKHVIFPGLFEWHFASTLPVTPDAAFLVIYANNESKRVRHTVSDGGTVWPVPPAPIGTIALIAH